MVVAWERFRVSMNMSDHCCAVGIDLWIRISLTPASFMAIMASIEFALASAKR